MRINKFLLGIILTVAAMLSSQSLYQNYDLSIYKNPDREGKALELKLDLNQNSFNNSDKSGLSQSNLNNNSYLTGNGSTFFSYLFSREEYQNNFYIYSSFSKQISDNKIENLNNSNSDNYQNGTRETFNNWTNIRWFGEYYPSSVWVVSIQPELNNTYHKYDNNTNFLDSAQYRTGKSVGKSDDNSLSYAIPLDAGYGRIYDVSSLRTAIYLIDVVAEKKRLKRTPNADELNVLAKLIDKIRNQRFFDTRDMEMSQLQTIDSFFVANQIAEKTDIEYYNSISDIWRYANAYRSSGWRATAGFLFSETNYAYDDESTDTKYVLKDSVQREYYNTRLTKCDKTNRIIGGTIKLAYEKPIGLNWQTGSNLEFLSGIQKCDFSRTGSQQTVDSVTHLLSTTEKFNKEFTINRASGRIYAGFYPNTRSYLQIGFAGSYSDLENMGSYYTLSGSLNGYFYFSPKLKLEAYFALNKDKTSNDFISNNQNNYYDLTTRKVENTYSSFNLSLSYSIF